MKQKKLVSGQSLFEVVVALAISALVVVALVSLVSTAVRNATFSKNKATATNFAQENIEWLRGQRDADTSDFIEKTLTSTWCFDSLDWSSPGICPGTAKIAGTPFTRQATFTTTTVATKEIIQASVVVSWEDSLGEHKVESITNYSDWRER